MDKEIIKFYQSRNLPIENLIRVGKRYHGVEKPFVEEALIQAYHDYHEGKIKKDISIAWSVWSLAKLISGREYSKRIRHELKEKNELIQEIEGLEDLLQMENHKNENLKLAILHIGIWVPTAILTAMGWAWQMGYLRW